MSNSIPHTSHRNAGSETRSDINSEIGTTSSRAHDNALEDGSEKSVQAPVMKMRQTRDAALIMPVATKAARNGSPLGSPTSMALNLSNRQTAQQKREQYGQARQLPAYQRYTRFKKTPTAKQGDAPDAKRSTGQNPAWAMFDESVSVDGRLALGRELGRDGMRDLIGWLGASPEGLRELSISVYRISHSELIALAEILRENKTITALHLGRGAISPEGALVLAEVLRVNKTLRSLKLDGNQIGDVSAVALAEGLRGNTNFSTLDLGGNNISAEGAAALAEILASNTSLTELQLERNDIGDRGAAALAKAFHANPSLTSLHLSANDIGIKGVAALVELLRVNKNLKECNLGYNSFGAEGALALAEVLQINTTIKILQLNHSEIGDDGILALANSLKGNASLDTLDLSGNEISFEGAEALAEGLMFNSGLTTLKLAQNEIGDVGAAALADVLLVNTKLTELDLSVNYISAAGAKALASALKKNVNLNIFNLHSNNICSDGAVALAKALRVNKTLTGIDLSFTKVEDDGAKALAHALKRNATILSLRLALNLAVSVETLREIDDLLDRNTQERLRSHAQASLDPLSQHSPAIGTMDTPNELLSLVSQQLPNEVLASTAEAAATVDQIKTLLAGTNSVVALSRWIDSHANPAVRLNWVDPASGYTLLHYAVAAQQGAVVKDLLARGIDLTKVDHNNRTAAQLAQRLADSSSSQAVAAIAALFR